MVLAGTWARGRSHQPAGCRGDAAPTYAATGVVAGHCFHRNATPRRKGVATTAGTTWVAVPIYVPFDVGLAALSVLFSRHAAKATLIASSAFVGASMLWYRKGWTNLWGTRPTAGLPLYAVATTAMIALRFAEVPRPRVES